jgi:hypothetical protein
MDIDGLGKRGYSVDEDTPYYIAQDRFALICLCKK